MKERDRLAALGQMAAGLAHEIRNPLGSIKGAAQYLQPGPTTENTREGTREFLDIIIEEVNRLNKIVSQFLDYARPYRGEQRQLEVADVLKKTLALITKEAEEHGRVEIAAEFADRMPPVRADAEQLLQVFLNLSLNAVQAMPHGGKLWIATALRRATRRGAAAAFLEVRFRDTGVGYPAGRPQEPVHPVLHDQGEGDGAGAADQPAHHREPRRDDRGALAAGRGGDVHGAAADRGRRLRQLLGGDPRCRGQQQQRRSGPALPPPPPGRMPPPAPAPASRRRHPRSSPSSGGRHRRPIDRSKLPLP